MAKYNVILLEINLIIVNGKYSKLYLTLEESL